MKNCDSLSWALSIYLYDANTQHIYIHISITCVIIAVSHYPDLLLGTRVHYYNAHHVLHVHADQLCCVVSRTLLNNMTWHKFIGGCRIIKAADDLVPERFILFCELFYIKNYNSSPLLLSPPPRRYNNGAWRCAPFYPLNDFAFVKTHHTGRPPFERRPPGQKQNNNKLKQ